MKPKTDRITCLIVLLAVVIGVGYFYWMMLS